MVDTKTWREGADFPEIEIIHYDPALASLFESINVEWLNEYFHVTPQDLEILRNPQRIINSGGIILFARVNESIFGTAALVKIDIETVELIKMGVSSKMKGMGIGKALLQAIIKEAKNMGAKKIILETAKPLVAAISLYQKEGFVQTSGEETHPLFGRTTFKMEKILRE